jgi:heat shock protein HspQ
MELKIDFDKVYLSSLLNDSEYSWLNEVFEEYINEDLYDDLYYHLFTENCCGDITVMNLETGEDLSEELYGELTAEQLNKLFDDIVEFYKSNSWKN